MKLIKNNYQLGAIQKFNYSLGPNILQLVFDFITLVA